MSAWSWMLGTVSLAVALALPSTTTRSGGAFPQRILVMFLTLAVIFVTFAGKGLVLPALIRRPDLGDGGADAGEETLARLAAAKGGTCQIDSLARGDVADAPLPGCGMAPAQRHPHSLGVKFPASAPMAWRPISVGPGGCTSRDSGISVLAISDARPALPAEDPPLAGRDPAPAVPQPGCPWRTCC